MNSVADFKIPATIIRRICKATGCDFIDVPVCFDEDKGFVGLKNGEIWVGKASSLGAVLANIIFVYLKNFQAIAGKPAFKNLDQENDVTLLLANFIRNITNNSNISAEPIATEPVVQRLYQRRLVWLLMKDIICPAYLVPIRNHRIINCNSPRFDVAGMFEEDNDGQVERSAFLNTAVEYTPCSDAALFLASLQCHELDPSLIIGEIFESELKGQLMGVAKLGFSDDEAHDFTAFLLSFSGLENEYIEVVTENIPNISSGVKDKQYKYAQYVRNFLDSSWWYFGLLEKMLEGARGADWSTYKRLTPHLKEHWDKIHKARREKGRDGLSFEALLRITSGESGDKKPRILESLLADDRVW